MLGDPTEYRDRDGRIICEGDIVEFSVEYDQLERPSYDTPTATKMQDIVIVKGGVVFFWNAHIQQGAYAWRHAEHCHAIGQVEHESLLADIVNNTRRM